MREIRSEIEVEASADEVWSVLTDFSAYADWNPFIRRAAGDLVAGQHIAVEIQPPGHRATSFKPRLLSVEPGRGFADMNAALKARVEKAGGSVSTTP